MTNGDNVVRSGSFAKSPQEVVKDSDALKLQGLNFSFLQKLQSAYSLNPQMDFSTMFNKYSEYFKSIFPSKHISAASPSISEPLPAQDVKSTIFGAQKTNSVLPPSTFSFSSGSQSTNTFPDSSFESPFKFSSNFGSLAPPASAASHFSFGESKDSSSSKQISSEPLGFRTEVSKMETSLASPDTADTSKIEQEEGGGSEGEESGAPPAAPVENDPYSRGPGEENETVIFGTNGNLYYFSLSEKKWKQLGKCSLRINQSNEDQKKTRILARIHGGTEKVVLNFQPWKGLTPELDEKSKSVLFPGLGSTDQPGKPSKFLFRSKNAADAKNLFDHFNKL